MTSRYTLLDPIEIEADIAAAECALADKRGPVSQWRPIETAPRDEDYAEYLVSDGKRVCGAVIFQGQWTDHFHDYLDPQPTHWMPLPPAPNTIDRDAMEGGSEQRYRIERRYPSASRRA